jgi:hypothetical protein
MSLKQAIQFALEDRQSGVRPGSDPRLTPV